MDTEAKKFMDSLYEQQKKDRGKMEVKIALRTFKELRIRGQIAALIRARKGYKCADCGFPIEKGEEHYCVYTGGPGFSNLKFPDRIHIQCVEGDVNAPNSE